MIRTFLGIELDKETCEALSDEIGHLRSHLPRVRWASEERFHLTLKFLGDIAEKELPALFSTLETATEDAVGFSMEIANMGAFPNPNRPRTIWADCGTGRDQFIQLATQIDHAFLKEGYPSQKKIHPHITLGRVKHFPDATGLDKLIDDAKGTCYGFAEVGAIVVYMSDLKNKTYTPMHRLALRSQ